MSITNATPIQYLVEINIGTTTSSWILGVSGLGHGTKLEDTYVVGADLSAMTGFISATITRGRQDELGTIQAGTATIVMDNHDGRFSPDYTSSPFYPQLKPGKQIRISAWYGVGTPTWIPIFYGYIDTIKPLDNGPLDGNCQITCVDWLSKAANADFNLTTVEENDYTRFSNIVASIGSDGFQQWYSMTVHELVQANIYASGTAGGGLQALTDLVSTTQGLVFVSRDGVIKYYNRHDKWSSPGTFSSSFIFDQGSANSTSMGLSVVPYVDPLDYDYSFLNLFNDVTVTTGGDIPTTSEVQDATSIHSSSKRSMSISAPILDPRRAKCLAYYLLARYKTPLPKVHSITVDLDSSNISNPYINAMLTLDLQDSIRIRKSKPASVSIDRNMFVEGITHTILANKGGHTVTIQASDQLQSGPRPWLLGHTGLGSASVLAY